MYIRIIYILSVCMYVHACIYARVCVKELQSPQSDVHSDINLLHSESQTTKQKFQLVTTVNAFISLSNLLSTAYDQ